MQLSSNTCVSAIARYLAQQNSVCGAPASATTDLQAAVERLEGEVGVGSRAAAEQHAATLSSMAQHSRHGGRQAVVAAARAAVAADSEPGGQDDGALQCLAEAAAGTTQAAARGGAAVEAAELGLSAPYAAMAALASQLTNVIAVQQRQLEQQQAAVAALLAERGMTAAGYREPMAGSLVAAASGIGGRAVLAAATSAREAVDNGAAGGSGSCATWPCNLPANAKLIGSVSNVS